MNNRRTLSDVEISQTADELVANDGFLDALGVPAERMAAACAELQRRGYAVREVPIVLPGAKDRRGWIVTEGTATTSGAPEDTAEEHDLAR